MPLIIIHYSIIAGIVGTFILVNKFYDRKAKVKEPKHTTSINITPITPTIIKVLQ